MLEIRREDAVIARHVGAWSRDQRSQSCEERQWVEHEVCCPVAEGVLELVYDLSMVIDPVRDSWDWSSNLRARCVLRHR